MKEFHKFLEEMLALNLEERVNDVMISENAAELCHADEDLNVAKNALKPEKEEQAKSRDSVSDDEGVNVNIKLDFFTWSCL